MRLAVSTALLLLHSAQGFTSAPAKAFVTFNSRGRVTPSSKIDAPLFAEVKSEEKDEVLPIDTSSEGKDEVLLIDASYAEKDEVLSIDTSSAEEDEVLSIDTSSEEKDEVLSIDTSSDEEDEVLSVDTSSVSLIDTSSEEEDEVLLIDTSPKEKQIVVVNTNNKVAAKMDQNIFTFNKVLIDSVYNIICFLYPVRGNDRDFARFFVLETVARVPYFAYLSVLHLRETFGERDLGDTMRTHYAEADNELHHLLIMESLGGNNSVIDRTLAQTMAFFYYWYVAAVYAYSKEAAYHLSELIEDHAYNTYDKYLKEHGDMLKTKEVPKIAYDYYVEDNPFLFDLFCTVKDKDEQGNFSTRRPKLDTLYDVFVNVRDDEKEHWKTLCNLVQYSDMQGVENSKVASTEPMPKTSN